MKSKRLYWMPLLALLGVLVYLVVKFRLEPAGYVATSQPRVITGGLDPVLVMEVLQPHTIADVLIFKGGAVRRHSCCGDEQWGAYWKAEDGKWIWRHRRVGKNRTFTREFIVEPGLFSISFTDRQSPSQKF